jgi:hypothetical protein
MTTHEGSLTDVVVEHVTRCLDADAVLINNDPGQLDDSALLALGLVHVRTDVIGGKRIRIYVRPETT